MKRYGSAITATAAGILDRLHPGPAHGVLTADDELKGRTCLVTGANTGLGLAVAEAIARRGGRVVMGCRTMDQQARRRIDAAAGQSSCSSRQGALLLHLDLCHLQSVEAFCQELRARQIQLDVVVLNAGVVPSRSRRTVDQLEEGFQVNYLANVVLVQRLLQDGTVDNRSFAEAAVSTSSAAVRPRIIFVSSEAHRSVQPPDWETLGRYRDYSISGAVREYGHTKLLLTIYAHELARRLQQDPLDVAVHAICPGAVNTQIGREAPRWSQPLLSLLFGLFFASPERAALPVLYLAAARGLEGQTGLYLHKMSAKPASAAARDEDVGRRLWAATATLINRCMAPP